VVLVPGIIFYDSAGGCLNALLRNKYFAYVVAGWLRRGTALSIPTLVITTALQPAALSVWKFQDLTSGTSLASRLYWFALAAVVISRSRIFFERKQPLNWRKQPY
jgi:hypothetical protein